jgi:LysR family nitrogen assimilation transcriptional regulator
MDLKQLEYFRHVAELGSFTRAASFLSVVQPALSRQVRQLEVELGQNLFERNGRGVVLTDAGNRLLEHTRGILMQVGRARQELEDQRDGDSGHFALGLPPSLGSSITVPLVKAFDLKLPNASLATVEGLSTYILEWLNVGRVDCALVYNAHPSTLVDVQPLLIDRLFLIGPIESGRPTRNTSPSVSSARKVTRLVSGGVKRAASRDTAITLAELANHPLIMPSRPHAMRMAVENALASVGKKINVVHEIESIPAIIDLARQGHGFGVLTRSAVLATQWSGQVAVRPIRNPALTISLSVATSTQRPRSPLMRKAIDLIRNVVQQEMRDTSAVPLQPNGTEPA